MKTRAAPPVFGLFLLATVAGGVAFCAVSSPDPIDRSDPVSQVSAQQYQMPAGAAAARTAEFNRRTTQNDT